VAATVAAFLRKERRLSLSDTGFFWFAFIDFIFLREQRNKLSESNGWRKTIIGSAASNLLSRSPKSRRRLDTCAPAASIFLTEESNRRRIFP
jgi:hypothetical protein